jgi:bacterioferritin (cytochrome b1)
MDARLHHLQREAEFVSSQSSALALLEEFHKEKLASMAQHIAHARLVGQYDANNTYQYVINRDDVQLSWLSKAIVELGGAVPGPAEQPAGAPASAKTAVQSLFEADVREAQAMIERWRPRVEAMTNARNRKMLEVILGETREQQRFFEQAQAGRTDLLGRRSDTFGPAQGAVLGDRWIE